MQKDSSNQQRPLTERQKAVLWDFDNRPVEEIPEDDLFLYVRMENMDLDQLVPLRKWGKTAHTMMLTNMVKMVEWSRRGAGEYERLITEIDERYQGLEYQLQGQWKMQNPAPEGVSLVPWHNQALLYAREILTDQLGQELGLV